MNPNADSFIKLTGSKFKFRLFLLSKLPAAFFSGVSVVEMDHLHSKVSIPYKWFTKNPFNSTYFACLSMAAEMSTGLLAMANTYKRNPGVSMLVTKIEGTFIKKAAGITTFNCSDGIAVAEIIDGCISGNESKIIDMRSQGINAEGEAIADFIITWSFRARK